MFARKKVCPFPESSSIHTGPQEHSHEYFLGKWEIRIVKGVLTFSPDLETVCPRDLVFLHLRCSRLPKNPIQIKSDHGTCHGPCIVHEFLINDLFVVSGSIKGNVRWKNLSVFLHSFQPSRFNPPKVSRNIRVLRSTSWWWPLRVRSVEKFLSSFYR